MLRYTKGDTKPDYTFLVQRNGDPVDLTDAQSVQFKLSKPSGAVVTRVLAIVGSAVDGEATGTWAAGDLDEAGEMWGDVVITWNGGDVQHGQDPVRVLVREEFTAP